LKSEGEFVVFAEALAKTRPDGGGSVLGVERMKARLC